MLTAKRGSEFAMQRLVLAVLFVTLAAAIVAYLAGRFSRSRGGRLASDAASTGTAMQRMSFFLLMCLMIYVFMNGAS